MINNNSGRGIPMSTGHLDIWITGPGEPCRITNDTYYVSIAHCNGEVLEWCDRRYLGLRAECGHLEVEVPPGCYQIRAVHHGLRSGPGGLYYGNWLTDSAIVEVSCGTEKCVKLYSPAAKTCGRLFHLALRQFGEQMGVDEELLHGTLEHLEALADQLPTTAAVSRRIEGYDELVEVAMEDPERKDPQPGEEDERDETGNREREGEDDR